MRAQRIGDGALRIARPSRQAGASGAALMDAARALPGVVDVVLTESWLGVIFADDVPAELDDARIDALFDASLALAASPALAPRTIEIAVRYDGVDLAAVARACGLDEARFAEAHSSAEYTVLFSGFQPGFAYLGGLPRALEVPRRASPRSVPKNAVAIAGPYAGVYPFEGPGGWNVIGTATNVALFDRDRGALLRAGDRVRFVRVER